MRAAVALLIWPHFVHRLDEFGPIIGARRVGLVRRWKMRWIGVHLRNPSVFVFNLCVPPKFEHQGLSLRLGQELLRVIDLHDFSAYCSCRVDNFRLMSAYQDFGFVATATLPGGKISLLERELQR